MMLQPKEKFSYYIILHTVTIQNQARLLNAL